MAAGGIARRLRVGSLANAVRWVPRLLFAHRRVLPDFIIVGAQKGGTTSLYSYLIQHPHVLPAEKKEVHFFDLNHRKGARWYRSHFPLRSDMLRREREAGARAITGEASPYYLFHPHAARRIAAVVPGVKLIVLLRDPAARAYSHYEHALRKKEEHLDFGAALARERATLGAETARIRERSGYRSVPQQIFSYLERGLYADQIEAYRSCFADEQMLILRSEDLFSDPAATYAAALEFLGLAPWRPETFRPFNVGKYAKGGIPHEEQLREFYRAPNERLYRLIGRDMEW